MWKCWKGKFSPKWNSLYLLFANVLMLLQHLSVHVTVLELHRWNESFAVNRFILQCFDEGQNCAGEETSDQCCGWTLAEFTGTHVVQLNRGRLRKRHRQTLERFFVSLLCVHLSWKNMEFEKKTKTFNGLQYNHTLYVHGYQHVSLSAFKGGAVKVLHQPTQCELMKRRRTSGDFNRIFASVLATGPCLCKSLKAGTVFNSIPGSVSTFGFHFQFVFWDADTCASWSRVFLSTYWTPEHQRRAGSRQRLMSGVYMSPNIERCWFMMRGRKTIKGSDTFLKAQQYWKENQ